MSNAPHHLLPVQEDLEFHGTTICPGIVIGHAYVVDIDMSWSGEPIAADQVETELRRYANAVATAKDRLVAHVRNAHGHSLPEVKAILDIHHAMLDDDSFHERVRKLIADRRMTAEWSLHEVTVSVMAQFNAMRDPYFQARGEDVRDMAHQLISLLTGGKRKATSPGKDSIFVSRHLHTSDAFNLQRIHGLAFVSESRALTSHAAILLKGFGVPTIGNAQTLLSHVCSGTRMIVDGTEALAILNPSAKSIADYQAKARTADTVPKRAKSTFLLGDGQRITLQANIEHPDQVQAMLAEHLQGIGLFRTEFLVGQNGSIPPEEEQIRIYRQVLEAAHGKRVVIRTFDLGGDKPQSLGERCSGRNPSLGLRGIRRHLAEQKSELRTQLRAILRASVAGKTAILFPMITTVDDVVAACNQADEVGEELTAAHIPFSRDVPCGAMIETPAAALALPEILQHASFVSIGTNDLLQYFMAADRDNELVAHYNNPANPAFLRFMKHIIQDARHVGRERDVTVCGEVSADPEILAHLLKMGFRTFSLAPHSATRVRQLCDTFAKRRRKT